MWCCVDAVARLRSRVRVLRVIYRPVKHRNPGPNRPHHQYSWDRAQRVVESKRCLTFPIIYEVRSTPAMINAVPHPCLPYVACCL